MKIKLWLLAACLVCGAMVLTSCTDTIDNPVTENDPLVEVKAELNAQYGENKKITDGNYDKSLAVKCINGTFVGRKTDNVVAYKGIPFVGEQPVGEHRWISSGETPFAQSAPMYAPHDVPTTESTGTEYASIA